MTAIFAIIGFIFCVALLGYFSLFVVMVCFNSLGKYNIGGVPNSFSTKLGAIVLVAVTAFVWYSLIVYGPIDFGITLK